MSTSCFFFLALTAASNALAETAHEGMKLLSLQSKFDIRIARRKREVDAPDPGTQGFQNTMSQKTSYTYKGIVPFILNRQELLVESENDKDSCFIRLAPFDRIPEALHAAASGQCNKARWMGDPAGLAVNIACGLGTSLLWVTLFRY